MKLGPVTKLDKRKTTTSKNLSGDVVSTNYDVIVILMIDLEQSGNRIQDAWSMILTFSLIAAIYLKK